MAGLKAQFDADFSKFVAELSKVEIQLKRFEPATDKASARMARLADSLQGHKLFEQATIAANAIDKVGGAATLSGRQLQQYGRIFDDVRDKARALGIALPESVQGMAAQVDGLRNVGQAAGEATGGLGQFAQSIASGLGIGIGINLVQSLASGLRDVAQLGAQLSPLQTAFTTLSGGAAAAELKLDALRGATKGLASDLELMQAANKGALLGLDAMGIDMAELSEVATRLGRAMGQDTAKSVDDLTTALARQSPMILDNLGIKLNLTEATERYARSLGLSSDALTDEQKKLAFASAAMEAARAKAAELGDISLTVADQVSRIGTSLENVVAHMGAAGNESGLLSTSLGIIADRLDEGIVLFGTMTERLGDAVPLIGRVSEAFGGLGGVLEATVAPGLRAINLALEGTIETLNKARALREWLSGSLGDVSFSAARTSDINLGGSFGQNQRALDVLKAEQARLTAEDMKAQDEALRKIEQGGTKAAAATKKVNEELLRLTGRRVIQDAERLADHINAIGASKIPTAQVEGLARQLMDARRAAQETGRAISDDIGRALNSLRIESARNPFNVINQGYIDSAALNATTSSQRLRGSTAGFTGDINSTNPLSMAGLAPSIEGKVIKVTEATRNWALATEEVAESFARLSQISGGLEGITQQIGKFFGALDAGKSVAKSLGLGGKAGGATAAGLAGGFLGFDLGQNFGRVGGTLAGAAGGAAAGVPLAAATGGLSIAVGAIAGGISGYFGSRQAESELRKLKDLQMQTIAAQQGGLDALLDTVGRLGLDSQTFLERWYGEPKEFAKGINELNIALAAEQREADKLAQAMDRVTRAQGVLNRDQLAALGGARPGSPIEAQARTFLETQNQQAISGLDRFINAGGALDPAQAAAAGDALGASFERLLQFGVPADQAIQQLTRSIEGFKKNAVDAGAGSTEAFDRLNLQLRALTDDGVGPLVERALGAGQALAGFANQGLVTQGMLDGLAPSLVTAANGIGSLGADGADRLSLLRGPLQTVWQLTEDFKLKVDDSTQALLDQAHAAGLIGEQFRPAEERTANGIERLVELFEGFGDLMKGLPAIAGVAADGMNREFGRIRVPSLDGITPGQISRGTPADGAASGEGGGVYMDGERVGYVVGRHLSGVAEFVGA